MNERLKSPDTPENPLYEDLEVSFMREISHVYIQVELKDASDRERPQVLPVHVTKPHRYLDTQPE